MKNTSPKRIAVFMAIIAILVFVLLQILVNMFDYSDTTVPFLLSGVFLIIIYLIFRYAMYKYLHNSIQLIHKKIHREMEYKKPERRFFFNMDVKDVLKTVDKEVSDWAKERNEEIEQLKRMAEYRKEYVGDVSHELKTPIFNIQGYILTLLDGGLEDPTINRDYLVKTEKNINRMISIVKDLESISRMETGELVVVATDFDMFVFTQEVIDSLADKASDKNITLSNGLPKDFFVHADMDKIRQVLTNLIVNAINYGKKNGEVKVDTFDLGTVVLIEVSDDGIGISEENISRIFERFYRVDKSRSTQSGGTGLGLAIVKHIIEAHHQTIHVRSKLYMGTTIGFTLPKKK